MKYQLHIFYFVFLLREAIIFITNAHATGDNAIDYLTLPKKIQNFLKNS